MCLFRSNGLDAQRMNFTTHQFAQGVIYEPMPAQGRFSGERVRDNEQSVVPTATFGALMPGMLRRIIDQFQAKRL